MKGNVEICVLMRGCPHLSGCVTPLSHYSKSGHIPYYQGNLTALYTMAEFYFVDHFGLNMFKIQSGKPVRKFNYSKKFSLKHVLFYNSTM